MHLRFGMQPLVQLSFKMAIIRKSPKIGLALGSGSARGWSHIGVLEALLEEGIKPDIICGSSIGAFVGSAYVAGKLDDLKKWTLSLTRAKVVSLMDISIARGGLIKGDLILNFLQEMVGDKHIGQYPLPFTAIATEFMTGREIWLQEGPMHEAVRASISIPGILAPFKIGDNWLLDGGLVNPVPASACRALGAEVIIAVNLNGDLLGRGGIATEMKRSQVSPGQQKLQPELLDKLSNQIPKSIREKVLSLMPKLLQPAENSPTYFDVLTNALNIMEDRITRSRLAGDPPHVMLVPRLAHFSLMDFQRAEEAIQEGRVCVEQSLPLLRKFL